MFADADLGPELFLSPAPIESAAEQCEIAEAVREIAEAAKTFKLQRGRRLPIGQSTPCLVPEEQRDMDGQEDIDCSSSVVIKVTKTPDSRNADVGQHVVCEYLHRHQIEHENDKSGCTIPAPTLRAEGDEIQVKKDGAPGLESTFASIPTSGPEETFLDGGFPTTAILANKGKRVDPREYGGASSNPSPMIVPVDPNSIGSPGAIEVVGVHLDKGKSVAPRKRQDGVAKHDPGPNQIAFVDYNPHYDSESSAFREQDIPLQSLEPIKATDLNHESRYDPTLPRLRWHPKISPYRLIVFSVPLGIGTAKAISSQKGSVTVPITLEWISGVVVFLVLFLLGSYETRTDIPKYLLWLFKPDCVDLVWYLAGRLSIRRPEYLSNELNELDLEFDQGHFVTSYRILVSIAVVFLGSLKTTFAYSNLSAGATWMEWFVTAFVSSLLYLVGLYENNSLGLWSSFFRKDYSHFIHMDMNRSDISLPSVTVFAFLLVLFSVQLVPAVERNFRNTLPEYINDSQFPMGPTLSKGTVEDIYFVVIFYIPFAIIYFVFLISLIRPLWAPILASTSMLPASIQDYTGRFFGAIERFAQRRAIDQMIYHFVALMQLLLFVTLNVWIILLLSFAHVLLQEEHDLTTLSIKILLYTSAIIMWILIWFIYGWFWAPGTRWFPTRDRLSRLLPPSIANANMSKFIQRQAEALRRLAPSSCSNSPRGHLFLFIIIYPVLSIVIFSGFYAFFNTGLHGGAALPLGVPVYILLAVLIGFWIYIGIKVFPAVFRDVLWRMRPALHYGFQDFTEGVRDSIEPHDYWVFNF